MALASACGESQILKSQNNSLKICEGLSIRRCRDRDHLFNACLAASCESVFTTEASITDLAGMALAVFAIVDEAVFNADADSAVALAGVTVADFARGGVAVTCVV